MHVLIYKWIRHSVFIPGIFPRYLTVNEKKQEIFILIIYNFYSILKHILIKNNQKAL